jgi:hypothetical protein
MENAEFEAFLARTRDPDLIPGIYNYCDRRCERCRFTNRCFHHRESARAGPERDVADSPESVAQLITRSLDRSMEMLRIAADRLGVDLSIDDSNAAEEIKKGEATFDLTVQDPLVVKSRDYTGTAWPIARALRPILAARGDPAVIDALDTIESLCVTVSSKTFRAMSGFYGDWEDPSELQSDANGSAKMARLLIEESRRAWRVLMEAGRASADGVPARLVALLDDLDNDLAARFPRAMDFIRPGFDTEPVRTAEVSMV